MLASDDHDPGDEDRSGSVACFCHPWCQLPICYGCGEDHGGNRGLCRDCDIERCFENMTCRHCSKMHTATEGFGAQFADALWGVDHRCTCANFEPARRYSS